jgi:hypothetical protein
LENVSFCSYHMKWLTIPIGQLERESGAESPVWISAGRRDPRQVMIPTKWAKIGRQVKQIVPKSTSTDGEEGNLGSGRRGDVRIQGGRVGPGSLSRLFVHAPRSLCTPLWRAYALNLFNHIQKRPQILHRLAVTPWPRSLQRH